MLLYFQWNSKNIIHPYAVGPVFDTVEHDYLKIKYSGTSL